MLKEILSDAKQLDITIDKDMSKEYIDSIYECLNKGYLTQTKSGFRISQAGKDYLENRLPINKPNQYIPNPKSQTPHKGTEEEKKWKTEFIMGFVYALLALLIGSVILKILKII